MPNLPVGTRKTAYPRDVSRVYLREILKPLQNYTWRLRESWPIHPVQKKEQFFSTDFWRRFFNTKLISQILESLTEDV